MRLPPQQLSGVSIESHEPSRFESKGLTLIRPPPIVPPRNSPTLPTPKDPPRLLLIGNDLRRKPLLVPCDMTVRDEVV